MLVLVPTAGMRLVGRELPLALSCGRRGRSWLGDGHRKGHHYAGNITAQLAG